MKPNKPKTQTPPERLRELEREARGMNYEGWCKSMGIDYTATGWAKRIEMARQASKEYDDRQRKLVERAWAQR